MMLIRDESSGGDMMLPTDNTSQFQFPLHRVDMDSNREEEKAANLMSKRLKMIESLPPS